MNYGRGFPLPHYRNTDSWTPASGMLPDNGFGQSRGSWTAAMFGGPIPDSGLGDSPVDDGVICSMMSTPRGNKTMKGGNWNPVIPNGKPISQISKPATNQVEDENWDDLVGMYQDFLQEEAINLNEVAQEHCHGIQSQIQHLNPTPIPKPNHTSNPASYFPCQDRNWDSNLLSAIVRPMNTSENYNGVQDLNRIPISEVQSNSVLKNQQSPPYTLDSMISGYNSQQLSTGGHYRPCYNLNSPPRSEPEPEAEAEAASSGITGALPFAPITPEKLTLESQSQSQRNENIGDSTSCAVSTTQKDDIFFEEGIDLNKTPNQKTPARRKKHRPKVIREVKPKTTPKTGTPDVTPVKRKYVKKKLVDVLESTQEVSPNGVRVKRKYVRKKEVEKTKTGVVETPVKSCKKQLNFDLEESQTREGINLNVNPQDIEQETRVNGLLDMRVAQSNVIGPSTPMAKTRDHALNILARNLTMRNGYSNHMGQTQSQPVNFDERRGIKRQFFEQVNPRNMNSLVMYQKLLVRGDARVDHGQDFASMLLEGQKRSKMQNDVSAPQDNSRTYRNIPAMQLLNSSQKHPESCGISQRLIQGHRVNPVTAMVSWNQPPATPPKDYCKPRSHSQVEQQSTKPKRGPKKKKVAVAVTVEDITGMLEGLCLFYKEKEKEKMGNAIVPYKSSSSNVIVPYEGEKKRKARPKVDLDPESDRLWRLLMGKEGSEADATMDKDKEKWWENERSVFRGRADSFIARMHLVQGDRRFSRWKGSVVDSVIGVFLTQNVSDHLSSSAFMSLAAKFSHKSTTTNEARCQNRSCVLVEEPIDTVLPDDRFRFPDKHNTGLESLIPSQDSSTIQTIDEIRSSSGSNSEAEDQISGPTSLIQPEKVNMFKDLFSREIPKTPLSGLLGESVSSLPSGYHRTSNIIYQHNEAISKEINFTSPERINTASTKISRERKAAIEDEKKKSFDWDSLRRDVFLKSEKKERSRDAKDSLDYEALRGAHVNRISDAIRERGMNNLLADRIKDFLDRLVRDHGSIDLEWLRDVPPDKAKDYLLSIRGLGLKSVECVRLLTLHHLAFPVDTNVGRIAVRLGWVPLQPLPESLQLHLLEMYPVLESIQKYLWPRLCKLDQLTLYELHYQMITFGKVFCTKSKPNCNACPMRAECRHFASAFASARLALPGPEEKNLVPSVPNASDTNPIPPLFTMSLPPSENIYNTNTESSGRICEPIIEEPTTPEPEPAELSLSDIEDQYYDDDADEIPTIKLDMNEFTINLQKSMDIQGDMSQALVALNPQGASIPTPKLKNVSRLRTEHQVYELPDSHPILEGLDRREPDDPSPYLLAIWTPGETANSMQPPERGCQAQETGILCDRTTCFTCNCIKEANQQVVRGTILMPCRTATRGSFPLNGTYFQVNEMFADHASSLKPIDVPRAWIWNLPRRTVYFGTSVSTIFKGLTTQEIQQCFWRGFVCVRGFDQKTRAPRPLMARLHFPASRLVNKKNEEK